MSKGRTELNVLQARAAAQQLAFGPMVFQAVRQLWKTGTLNAIEASGESGIGAAELAAALHISRYGMEVLCEAGASAGVISEDGERYRITKVGSLFLHDRLTQVNADFVHDVCYQGMFFLEEAIRDGRPAGLQVFSEAETIYQCVTELPEAAQRSWYEFDHYYSDRAFGEAAKIVFAEPVRRLLDIGGNTGRWARRCVATAPDVEVTIADLPGQLEKAEAALTEEPGRDRVHYHPVDLLAAEPDLPGPFDVIWMSQFLDCFSEQQIGQILATVKPALAAGGRVCILETLVDRQRYDAATYSLNAISLYFTTMANGASRMYRSTTLERLLTEQGYRVTASHDDLGMGHTLLECRPD